VKKTYTAELIAVGTELLLGNIANTDAQMLSRGLSELGINVYHHSVVGDNPERVREVVEIARRRADILITTGGLGPTYDDLTKQTVAACFGLELELHPEVERELRDYFSRRAPGGHMPESNLQQAMLPVGCTVLRNGHGTAPGCAFEADGTHVLMLPGPPRECEAMFREAAVPYLKKLSGSVIRSRNVMTFGLGESAVEEKLRPLMTRSQNPTVAPYVTEGEVRLRLTASAETAEEAEALLAPMTEEVCRTLGPIVYGVDVKDLAEAVVLGLKERGLTLSAAESCTGGLLSKRLTDIPGASQVFPGTVVSYANEVKERVLGVSRETLRSHGAVSKETALEMARGVREITGSDLSLAVTGVAGPDGGTAEKPVGTVFVALETPDGAFCRRIHAGEDRARVRNMSCNHAFDMVRRYLTGLPVEGRAKA